MFLVPFSGGGLGKSKGSELAPKAIIEKLKSLGVNETGLATDMTVKEIKVVKDNFSQTHINIFETLRKEQKFLVLGGDHSITYSAYKAFATPKSGIVIFDAHPDLMQEFSPSTHENYLRNLIEEGIVKAQNVVLVATRQYDAEEFDYIKKKKIQVFSMREIEMEDVKETCDAVMAACKDFEKLYLSIDIDAVDGALVSTGYPEPAGLTPRELVYFVQRLSMLKNLRAADIVEAKVDENTIALCAKLVQEIKFGC